MDLYDLSLIDMASAGINGTGRSIADTTFSLSCPSLSWNAAKSVLQWFLLPFKAMPVPVHLFY